MSIGIVNTKYGKISGVEYTGEYKGITAFKGVPYAKPPVGELRWKPPVEPEPWEGVKECSKYGPAAMQVPIEKDIVSSVLTFEEYYYEEYPKLSEDCLYLNIYTGAERSGEKRPVYMWFHGGGLTNGYGFEPEHNPLEMVKRGIVVVQVTQRLNIFGYIALPQLSAEQGGTSGNYGFMDEVRALDWVYENIEAFGGNPENITAGGQSGGSRKSFALAASPKSRGRIRRIINESGLDWVSPMMNIKDAEQIGLRYLEASGINLGATADELRAMSTEEIFHNVGRAVMPGNMVQDQEWLPFSNLKDTLEGLEGVSFLGGSTLGESEVFAGKGWNLNTDRIEKPEAFYAHYKEMLGDWYEEYDFESLVPVDEKNVWRTMKYLTCFGLARKARANKTRCLMMNRMLGNYMTKKHPGTHVYTYLWSHVSPVHPDDTARDREYPWHSSEMWYVFKSMREGVPPVRPWRTEDYAYADKAIGYWTNFIKNGDPNGQGLAKWPETGENYGWMDFGVEIKGHDGSEWPKLDELIRKFISREYGIEKFNLE